MEQCNQTFTHSNGYYCCMKEQGHKGLHRFDGNYPYKKVLVWGWLERGSATQPVIEADAEKMRPMRPMNEVERKGVNAFVKSKMKPIRTA